MATRSTIARQTNDGIESIYSHFDGYPSYVGRMLRDWYTDDAKITELFALGDLSVLDKEIGTENNFDQRIEGVCLFYGRDRGEVGQHQDDETHSLTHPDYTTWLDTRKRQGCEYGYLWDGTMWTTHPIF